MTNAGLTIWGLIDLCPICVYLPSFVWLLCIGWPSASPTVKQLQAHVSARLCESV